MHKYYMRTDITQTGSALVTLAEAKAHMRITHTSDDDYITSLVAAATAWAEHEAETILIASTVEDYWQYPVWIYNLTKQPVTALVSVEYYGTAGWTAFTDYKKRIRQLGYSSVQFLSHPEYDQYADDVVRVTYTADISRNIAVAKQLVMLITSQMYEQREIEVTGTIVSKVTGYEHLVNCLKPAGGF